MKVVQTYVRNGEPFRVKVINRETDEYQIYGAVVCITEEVECENGHGFHYRVLHHDGGETSTFNNLDWRVQVETFQDL